jgi:hypothetical protein
MRVTSASIVTGACALALAGCPEQEVGARSRFVEDGVDRETDVWVGESIVVESSGVTTGGGLRLEAGDSTRVRASARLLAIADTDDKPSADAAIDDVKANAYSITTTGAVTTVRCGHGAATRSVSSSESGCDALDVTMPLGSVVQPLSLSARSGQGQVLGLLAGATLANLEVHGKSGKIEVTAPTTRGATILIVAETGDDVVLHLAADFAADALVLEAPPERLDTSAFPDVQPGKGRGEAGRGAKSITVRAGRIVLALPE